MLLGIYLGTTATSWILTIIGDKAMNNRLNREGYIDTSKEKTFIEKVNDFIPVFLIMSIPVVNLILGGVTVFANDKIYKDYKSDGINDGTIIRKPYEILENEKRNLEEKRLHKLEEELRKEEKQNYQMNKITRVKSYSEMSPLEKLEFLESEKEALLREIDSSKNNEKGPVKKIGTRKN